MAHFDAVRCRARLKPAVSLVSNQRRTRHGEPTSQADLSSFVDLFDRSAIIGHEFSHANPTAFAA
jgi:hypothetical protein